MKKFDFEKMDNSMFESLDVAKMKRVKGGYTMNTFTVYSNGTSNSNDGTGCQDGVCND
ncbi:rSAM-modified peptide [Hymenobacter oligotrophus]|uniref:RSAM-modified peptide n=1 Tax=Hymenobacter oligotrophus TaxID=2319843 RepID=A0A3B7QX36_9BACT|nr:rSAM-modified peptide [Hymenobacter oligotrophus]AYA37708.1 rSAM-modified peptide [Hymenobacter oligotrophus]